MDSASEIWQNFFFFNIFFFYRKVEISNGIAKEVFSINLYLFTLEPL